MVWDFAFQAQAAEPTVGQIQMDLFAQPSFGPDAEAVSDNQHADHQLGVDRWPARQAIEIGEMPAQIAQIEESIDAT